MKKRINTDSVESELRQSSPFFRQPPSPPPAPEPAAAVEPQESPALSSEVPDFQPPRTPERVNERTSEGSHASPNARTVERRRARRASYEIYEDQIERIKTRALADQLAGGELSQSEIVRAAIDRYFAESGETE